MPTCHVLCYSHGAMLNNIFSENLMITGPGPRPGHNIIDIMRFYMVA